MPCLNFVPSPPQAFYPPAQLKWQGKLGEGCKLGDLNWGNGEVNRWGELNKSGGGVGGGGGEMVGGE